jgi:hypothetical protein
MTTPYINPYLAPYKPLSNITPFTYKDGLTYLEVLEALREYLNTDFVEFVNENFTALGDDFETQVNILITAVNEAIQSVIESSAEAQDAVVAELIADVESASRVALDALYAGQVTNAAIAAIVVTGATKTALDTAYANQVTNGAIADIVVTGATKTALDSAYAGQVTNAAIAAIVVTGDTKTALDSAYAGQVTDSAVAAVIEPESETANAIASIIPPVSLESPDENLSVAISDSYAGLVHGDPLDGGVGILLIYGGPGVYLPYVLSPLGLNVTGDPSGSGNNIALNPTAGQFGVVPSGGSSLSNTAAYVSLNGIKVPAFATEALPDAENAGTPNGLLAFDLTEGILKVTFDDAWHPIGGGGGGFDPAVDEIAIGTDAVASGENGIAIGNGASVTDDNSIAIGNETSVTDDTSIAIGNGAVVGATHAAVIGDDENNTPGTIRLGYGTLVFAGGSITLSLASDFQRLLFNDITLNTTYIVDGTPPTDHVQVGTMAWEFDMGIPLWLKSIETDPADNVWVDATGETVYPTP